MAQASLYGRTVETIFELLGDDEPALTNAVGWALAESPRLRHLLIKHVFGEMTSDAHQSPLIRLQPYAKTGGFTDIEVVVPGELMLIIEAKRGWALPSAAQLEKYAARFDEMAAP